MRLGETVAVLIPCYSSSVWEVHVKNRHRWAEIGEPVWMEIEFWELIKQ
jgi:hypothetical protein